MNWSATAAAMTTESARRATSLRLLGWAGRLPRCATGFRPTLLRRTPISSPSFSPPPPGSTSTMFRIGACVCASHRKSRPRSGMSVVLRPVWPMPSTLRPGAIHDPGSPAVSARETIACPACRRFRSASGIRLVQPLRSWQPRWRAILATTPVAADSSSFPGAQIEFQTQLPVELTVEGCSYLLYSDARRAELRRELWSRRHARPRPRCVIAIRTS